MSKNTKNYEVNTSNKNSIASNQEITTRKWKFESLFRFLIGIVYGLFFGSLSSTFLFTENFEPSAVPLREIYAVISLLIIGSLSIILIFWTFKGEIKKYSPLAYMLVHLINGIVLFAGVLLVTILYPTTLDMNRYFILGIFYFGWSLIMIVAIAVLLWINKRKYPLSWSKVLLSIISMLLLGLIEFFGLLSVKSEFKQLKEQALLFLIAGCFVMILSILVFGFGIAYIRRYRDVLLGERTEYEINTIKDWESSRILAITIMGVTIFTYAFGLIFNYLKLISLSFNIFLLIELVVDAVLVIPYAFIITRIRIKNSKNKNKNFHVAKTFKPVDNSLLIDFFTWIILFKSVLLQGFTFNAEATLDLTILKSIMLLATGISLVLLYGFNVVMSVNIPNLRNTAVTIPTIAFAIISLLFIILFSGYLKDITTINGFIFIFLPLFPLIGISVSLIIKIFIIAKIFKVNWRKASDIDRSEIDEKQKEEQDQDLIGERTTEVDAERLKFEEQILKKAEKTKTQSF